MLDVLDVLDVFDVFEVMASPRDHARAVFELRSHLFGKDGVEKVVGSPLDSIALAHEVDHGGRRQDTRKTRTSEVKRSA